MSRITASIERRTQKSGREAFLLRVRKKGTDGKWTYLSTETFHDREQAELAAAKYRVFTTAGGTPERGTLAEYLTAWLARREAMGALDPETLNGYRTKLASAMQVIGHHQLAKLRPRHVREWLDHMRVQGGISGKPASASTAKQARAILHAALADAVDDDIIPMNPAAHLGRGKKRAETADERKAKPAVLTLDQTRDYLAAMARDPVRLMFYQIAFFTGLRRSEVGGLTWAHVDLDGGVLHVVQKLGRVRSAGVKAKWVLGPAKSGSAIRSVHMDDDLVALLRAHRAAQLRQRMGHADLYNDQGFVIADEIGNPLSLDATTKWAGAIRDEIGLPKGVQPTHVLRKVFATQLHEAGVSDAVLQSLMGHATIETTRQHYLTARDEKRIAASRVMSGLLK